MTLDPLSQTPRRDGAPLLVGPATIALTPVPLASGGAGAFSEAWLQDLLHRHPEILPMRSIEPGFSDLVAICRELPTPHGPIDNLFMTAQGDIIIVEAKLWRNPQARREVVAQALDYASCLFGMSYEAFEAAVLKGSFAGQGKPKSLHALLQDGPDALTEEAFVDAVAANLARGRIVVLVVGDGIRAETERLADALQSHAGFHFTFALVELAVFSIPHREERLVLPRTLARTTMIERGIVRIDNGQVRIMPVEETGPTPGSLGTITAEQFLDAMAARNPRLPAALKALLARLEDLGVYAEFQRSLNLKWDAPSGQSINVGYITRNGQVHTDAANWHAPKSVSHRYIDDLAAAWDGEVDRETLGENWQVRRNGKQPRIEAVMDRFGAWAECIARFISRLRERAAEGNGDPGEAGESERTPVDHAPGLPLRPVFMKHVEASDRERLEALARFEEVFAREGFTFGHWHEASEQPGKVTVMGWFEFSREGQAFLAAVYDYGWVRDFDWLRWAKSRDGERLWGDPAVLARADQDQLAQLLTACVRQDRFCEGTLFNLFEAGLLTGIVRRAAALLREQADQA